MEKIKQIHENKKDYLNLLLLADPSEEAIDKYLNKGDMFILLNDDIIIAEAVLTPYDHESVELKNFAVNEKYQKQGYGSKLLNKLFYIYKIAEYANIYVGTAENGVKFYSKLGFIISHIEKDFFINNYPEPIYDDGILCKDMIYLKKSL